MGLFACVLAAAAFFMPFASVSHSRVATGQSMWVWDVAGPAGLVALALPWCLVLAASLAGAVGRRAAFVRGISASVAILAWLFVSGAEAAPALAQVGPYARYSLGSGVWLSGAAASVVVVAARREVGAGSVAGWVVTLAAPVGIALCVLSERLDALGIMVEYHNLGSAYWPAVAEHVVYSAASIAVATVVGVGLGILAYRNQRLARPVFGILNVFQTIPGLALVGMLVLPLASLSRALPVLRRLGVGGLGWAPLVLALTLYAMLAIARNTYAGLKSVPPATVEAGIGVGMTSSQVVRRVQMPLATPIVFSGVRTASQQTIGSATLGAFVAAGGLGPLVFLGIAQQAKDLVLLGSVSIVALALVIDALMSAVQHLVTPRHVGKVA